MPLLAPVAVSASASVGASVRGDMCVGGGVGFGVGAGAGAGFRFGVGVQPGVGVCAGAGVGAGAVVVVGGGVGGGGGGYVSVLCVSVRPNHSPQGCWRYRSSLPQDAGRSVRPVFVGQQYFSGQNDYLPFFFFLRVHLPNG